MLAQERPDFRAGVLLAVGDVRMPHDVAHRIGGAKQAAHFPQAVEPHRRIAVPERGHCHGFVHIDLLRRHHAPAPGKELPVLRLQPSQVVQLDADGITVQPLPSRVGADAGVPRLRVERHQLDDFPSPPDDQVGGSLHVLAGEPAGGRQGACPGGVVEHNHLRSQELAAVLRAGEVLHLRACQAMVGEPHFRNLKRPTI